MVRPILLALILFFSLKSHAQGSLEGDRLALIALYKSASGNDWYRNSGWNPLGSPGDSPCGWYGITCAEGRVTEIRLHDNGPFGEIPPQIGNLTNLVHLDLFGAGREFYALFGPIPVEITNLKKLEYLDLTFNDFDANGVALIGSLTALKYLSLAPEWPIPVELGNLTNLEHLYLAVDDPAGLSGGLSRDVIPVSLGNLIKLKTLDMHNAGVLGAIPTSLGNLVNLETLDLSHNHLSGSIPSTFTNLVNLVKLDLTDNELGGTIPDLSGILVPAQVSIASNAFTFDGLDPTNVARLDSYTPQDLITLDFNAGSELLTAHAGGIVADNTYKWYRNSVLVATIIGSKTYAPSATGTYRAEVTSSVATALKLISKNEIVTTLPVTLVSFAGHNEENGNLLHWKTTSETNNAGFGIERSADALTFTKIGFLDGKGDSKALITYDFTDSHPLATSYYRLKQIDFDGQFEYSRIIAVKRDPVEMVIYPNPAQDHVEVKNLKQTEQLTIRNASGATVSQQLVLPGQKINVTHLANGLYTISIRADSKKLAVQK